MVRNTVRLPMMQWKSVTKRPEQRQAATTRAMVCLFCGQNLQVPRSAINTRCTNCHKHLPMEDVVIAGDSPLTRVCTCGKLTVEPSGRIAGTLQASEAIIAGRVLGTIQAGNVQVLAGGKVAGTIIARHCAVSPGGVVHGEIHVVAEDGTVSVTKRNDQ